MSIWKIQLLGCLLIFAGIIACTTVGSNAMKLTEKDAGSTVHIREGGTVEIALAGNPTTGYTWEIAPGTGDLLAQQGEPEFKADSGALGSGGIMTMRFKAVKQGTAGLKLIYHRTFEPNVPPLQSFDVTIVVD